MLNTMFEFVFASSVAATVLFLIASVIRPLTNKFFSAGWHCYMWLAILILMVLPLKINIPIPSSDISYEFAESAEVENYNVITYDVLNISEQNITETFSPLKNITVNYAEYIALIWFILACILLGAKIAGYIFLLRKIRIDSNVISCPEISNFTSRRIIVRCSKSLSSPLLLGIIKPQLILPDVNLSPEQLNNILLHEMTHFKRKDILLKWFACLVKCIHWFNPIVYIINSQINTDCEIACDIEVTKNMNEHEKKNYINTIIFLIAQSKSKSLSLTTAMASNKAILKKRFAIIKSYKKSKKTLPLSICVSLILITLSVFAGGLISNKITPYVNNIITPVKTDARNGNSFNFLIIGEDEGRKADTIIVFSFQEDKATVLSIPRSVRFNADNRFVRITEVINEKNGNQKAIEAIQRTLAIPINYYARINISTVKKILNELGDIEFNIPIDMSYEDPYQNLHINLKKGMHSLDGEKALQLLRFRRYPEGDIGRIKMQQEFLKEVISQKRNHLASKSYALTKLISENVITNY